jgi:hypothetical protein
MTLDRSPNPQKGGCRLGAPVLMAPNPVYRAEPSEADDLTQETFVRAFRAFVGGSGVIVRKH